MDTPTLNSVSAILINFITTTITVLIGAYATAKFTSRFNRLNAQSADISDAAQQAQTKSRPLRVVFKVFGFAIFPMLIFLSATFLYLEISKTEPLTRTAVFSISFHTAAILFQALLSLTTYIIFRVLKLIGRISSQQGRLIDLQGGLISLMSQSSNEEAPKTPEATGDAH